MSDPGNKEGVSEEGNPSLNWSLILTVSFFGALGVGMVGVMLAGLWFRFCSKQKSRGEQDPEQSDDQDYRHLQLISRSSSFNPVSLTNSLHTATNTPSNSKQPSFDIQDEKNETKSLLKARATGTEKARSNNELDRQGSMTYMPAIKTRHERTLGRTDSGSVGCYRSASDNTLPASVNIEKANESHYCRIDDFLRVKEPGNQRRDRSSPDLSSLREDGNKGVKKGHLRAEKVYGLSERVKRSPHLESQSGRISSSFNADDRCDITKSHRDTEFKWDERSKAVLLGQKRGKESSKREENSKSGARKTHRPSLTRQAQITIAIPGVTPHVIGNTSQAIHGLSPHFPRAVPENARLRNPPITVSRTFDVGDGHYPAGDNFETPFAASSARRKTSTFRKHHSTCSPDRETSRNFNQKSQEFLQVPEFLPGRGLVRVHSHQARGTSNESRRSSFEDRGHPAWRSAESYHLKPETRRSFDDRLYNKQQSLLQNTEGLHANHLKVSSLSLQHVRHTWGDRGRRRSQEPYSADGSQGSPRQTDAPSSRNSSLDKTSPRQSQDRLRVTSRNASQDDWNHDRRRSALMTSPANSFDCYICSHAQNKFAGGGSLHSSPRLCSEHQSSKAATLGDMRRHGSKEGKTAGELVFFGISKADGTQGDAHGNAHIGTTNQYVHENTVGKELWNLRATLELSESGSEEEEEAMEDKDEEDDEEVNGAHVEAHSTMHEIRWVTSMTTGDFWASQASGKRTESNRVTTAVNGNYPAFRGSQNNAEDARERKIAINGIKDNCFSSENKKSEMISRMPLFGTAATSFDSSGTADSECSGTAQVVGVGYSSVGHYSDRRKFSSSISIPDDIYAEQESFSDSNNNSNQLLLRRHQKGVLHRHFHGQSNQSNIVTPTISPPTSAALPHKPSLMLPGNGKDRGHALNMRAENVSSAMNISELGLRTRRDSYVLSAKEEDSLELDSLKERIVQETEKSERVAALQAKSRRHAYHKRRSTQVSESLEGDGRKNATVFVGGELNSSLTSSGSLNNEPLDVDNDVSFSVNRRLLPPSYRAVIPAGRDYSIDKKTDMIFREFLKTDSATILKLKYSYKTPRRMRRSPRNVPICIPGSSTVPGGVSVHSAGASPRLKQEDSIEETEGESCEGDSDFSGVPQGTIPSPKEGERVVGRTSTNHLSVGYVPGTCPPSSSGDWYQEEFPLWRARRLLPPIKSQDSTSSDVHGTGSAPMSRNASINKP